MITRSGGPERSIVRERAVLGLGPTAIRRLIDVLTIVLALATVVRWWDTDLIVDALWVTIAIGAFLFGLRSSLVRIVLATGAIVVHSALVGLGAGQEFEWDLVDVTDWSLLIVISIVVAVMADRLSTTARRYAALYRQASDRLVTAHEDERRSLARDLHDGVGQTLTAAVLTLDAAEAALAGNAEDSPITAHAAVRRAKSLVAGALDEARDVAARLRPVRLTEIGLGAAIRDLAYTAGAPVDVRFDPMILPPGLLEHEREIDAYRILQEAIGNATRHSQASHIWVEGDVREEVIYFTVGDDGIGFDPSARAHGLGLASINERADALLGEAEVFSTPGVGTLVKIVIPILTGPGSDQPAVADVASLRPATDG